MRRILTPLLLSLTPVAAGSAPPELALEPTPIKAGAVTYDAQIGTLRVPERRDRPGSRRIELAVARLRSTAAEPGPPLVYLAGGPGNAATGLARSPHWGPFLELGDVVLMDHRGVGRSRPQLTWSSPSIRPARWFGDRDTAMRHMVDVAAQAAGHFAAEGVDLAGYTAVEAADDVDDLRRALGAERVRLLAHSYGTHLGQAIIRRHGAHVDRFVSVGTAGMDDIMKLPSELDESLRRLAAVVAERPSLAAECPDLFALTERVMRQLERTPMTVTVRDPRDGQPVEVAVGRFGLQLVLLADLGDTADLPVFPRLLASIERGDPSVLQWFVQKRYAQLSELPVLTFVCRGASGATAERWTRIEREAVTSPFGRTRTLFSPEIDRALGTPDLGDDFRAAVASDVPVLFVSGTLDASTPPEQAERVRAGFSDARHVVVEHGGHEDILRRADVRDRIVRFLGGEALADERLRGDPPQFVPLTGPDRADLHPAVP